MKDKYKIVVDTREQKPLWDKGIIRKALKVGDYSIEGQEEKIAIERKSAGDLFGTLGGGHARFKKELAKALEYDYFAIVVEAPYDTLLKKDFPGGYNSRMKGFVVMSILFTIHVKYGIPVFMASNRVEAKHIIKELFKAYTKIYMFNNNKLYK